MDESVVELLAAARLIRDSQEASDAIWTDAHERLYAAIRSVEASRQTTQPSPEPRPSRRGPNWRPNDLGRLPPA